MGKGTGCIYIIVGAQNTGKSAIVIELCKKSNRWTYIYDHHREYLQRFGKRQCTIFYDRQTFLSKIPEMRNGNIIFEEGTTFLSFSKDMDMADTLTSVYHNGNIMYIIFHSMADIPSYILRLSHILILFRTGDEMEIIERKAPSLAHHLHYGEHPKFIKLPAFHQFA